VESRQSGMASHLPVGEYQGRNASFLLTADYPSRVGVCSILGAKTPEVC